MDHLEVYSAVPFCLNSSVSSSESRNSSLSGPAVSARSLFPRQAGLAASWDLDPIEEIEDRFAGDDPDLRRRSVMIVETDLEQLSYLSSLLTNDTFRVIAADSALEGLRIANVVYLDLVICNAAMTGGSGSFFLKHFRSLPFCKFVPVIMLAEYEPGAEMFPSWNGVDAWCLKDHARARLARLTRYFLDE